MCKIIIGFALLLSLVSGLGCGGGAATQTAKDALATKVNTLSACVASATGQTPPTFTGSQVSDKCTSDDVDTMSQIVNCFSDNSFCGDYNALAAVKNGDTATAAAIATEITGLVAKCLPDLNNISPACRSLLPN